jgi:hypothetical protein
MGRRDAMEAAAKRLRGQVPLELWGDVRATFPGYGLIELRWEDGGYLDLHATDLDALVERANDVYGQAAGE